MIKISDGAIKRVQSRDISNTGYTRHGTETNKQECKHNTFKSLILSDKSWTSLLNHSMYLYMTMVNTNINNARFPSFIYLAAHILVAVGGNIYQPSLV